MSQRRKAGEIVQRGAGSAFILSDDPKLVRVPDVPHYYLEAEPCLMGCGDPECLEWPNLEVIIDGHPTGEYLYHISECQMGDL